MAKITTPTLTSVRSTINTHLISLFTWFGAGTGSTPASANDTSLVAETFQKEIEQSTNLTTSLIFSGFQNALENNGNDFAELGFKTGSGGTLRARAIITPEIEKTSFREIWSDIEIKNTVIQI